MIDLDLNFDNKLSEVKNTNSESLAAYIVLYRSLGIGKNLALACMTELSTRRSNGDDFNFEAFIEEEVGKIPKPPPVGSSLISLKSILKGIK
jgi:hypothetical protein